VPLSKIRTTLTNRLIERREHRRLSAELAAFQTPAERIELDEILSRYPLEQTREIREILDRQDNERQQAAASTGRGYHNRTA
jgi:hypothetical protein